MSAPHETATASSLGIAGSPRRFLTADALASELGTTRRWVYGQVDANELPGIRIGRRLLFDRVAVDAWLRRYRIGAWPKSCGDPDRAAGISDEMTGGVDG